MTNQGKGGHCQTSMFFKNWTRYEFHIISKLLLTTNVPLPKESKGINQRESGNLAKEAIIGLNAEKP